MFKRTIFLQAFLLAALGAISNTNAGIVVSREADIGSSNEVGKSVVANSNRHLASGKGKGKGGSKGKGKGKGGSDYGYVTSYYGKGKGKGGSAYGYDSGYGYGKGKGKGGNSGYGGQYSSGYGYYGKGKGSAYGYDSGYVIVGDDVFSDEFPYSYSTPSAPTPSAPTPSAPAPSAPTPSAPTLPTDGNSGCIEVAFQESFLFLSADLAIPPTSSDPNEIGTTFIYQPSPLFNDTEFTLNGASVELEDSQVTGVCTRTSSTLESDTGGGVCQFTILAEGSYIIFGGFVEDYVVGSPTPSLVISGGSSFNTGITGEVALLPLDGNGDAFTGDFFFDAFGYQASTSGVMLVCEVIDGTL